MKFNNVVLVLLFLGLSACGSRTPQSASPSSFSMQQSAAVRTVSDMEINALFPAAVGYQSAYSHDYGINRKYRDCINCNTDKMRILYIKVSNKASQMLQLNLDAEEHFTFPAASFWSGFCKTFIEKHAQALGMNWQFKGWTLKPGTRTVQTYIGNVEISDLHADLMLGNQPIQAHFQISKQFGLVSFHLANLAQDTHGDFVQISEVFFSYNNDPVNPIDSPVDSTPADPPPLVSLFGF
jgi:hypothetical protein